MADVLLRYCVKWFFCVFRKRAQFNRSRSDECHDLFGFHTVTVVKLHFTHCSLLSLLRVISQLDVGWNDSGLVDYETMCILSGVQWKPWRAVSQPPGTCTHRHWISSTFYSRRIEAIFGMLSRHAGLSATAGLFCLKIIIHLFHSVSTFGSYRPWSSGLL